ncbi:MAG: DUF885 domain-containing protein [Chloroflexota bacterium]|nr:DUF885 domain-containing protein [Chloroflexota bacterium]
MSAIYDLADDYVVRYAALSPNAATSMGIPGHETELTDFSPDGHEARAVLERETLAALAAATVEDDRDRVARDAMSESMRLSGELHDAGERFRSLNILASPLQSLRRVFDLMPRDTEEHWSNIAARLAALPTAVDGLRQTLDTGIERGMVSTQRQASECAKQCATWSGAAGVPSYFDGLAEAFEASDVASEGLAAELRTGAAAANEAFAGFGRYLDETYVPAAEPHDPVGRDRYALGVQVFTGASPDLDETYAWGWSELHRIEAEMEATAERIAPGVGVEGVKELLEADPDRAIDGVDAFQQWMQNLQETTIAELNGTHFDLPEEVQRIEAMIAPPGGPLAMYYTGPSEDFSRPGRTWYPTAGKTRFPLWGEVSIAYHEGVPGHHLQIGMTVYLREHLSRWQRLLGGSSGYSEGWGLYAERLMGELGYLENPDYYLGMLRAQALRCARIVVDIGMHLELPIAEHDHFHPGETWTPELGLEFVLQRAHFPADFMASEVDRYLGVPGQAISYKVGERAWLDARKAARRRDGSSFDLKAFHAQAFELGPMGLDQMRRELGG